MRRLAAALASHTRRCAADAASAGLRRIAQPEACAPRSWRTLQAPGHAAHGEARGIHGARPSSAATGVPALSFRRFSSPPAEGDGASAGPTSGQQQAVAAPANSRRNLLMVYTCGNCDKRSVMAMSKQSYENGVVLVKCPGCGVLHLVADRKGWFGEPGSVEDFLRDKGEAVLKRAAIKAPETGAGGTIELLEEELMGWSQQPATAAAAERGPSGAAGGGDVHRS